MKPSAFRLLVSLIAAVLVCVPAVAPAAGPADAAAECALPSINCEGAESCNRRAVQLCDSLRERMKEPLTWIELGNVRLRPSTPEVMLCSLKYYKKMKKISAKIAINCDDSADAYICGTVTQFRNLRAGYIAHWIYAYQKSHCAASVACAPPEETLDSAGKAIKKSADNEGENVWKDILSQAEGMTKYAIAQEKREAAAQKSRLDAASKLSGETPSKPADKAELYRTSD